MKRAKSGFEMYFASLKHRNLLRVTINLGVLELRSSCWYWGSSFLQLLLGIFGIPVSEPGD